MIFFVIFFLKTQFEIVNKTYKILIFEEIYKLEIEKAIDVIKNNIKEKYNIDIITNGTTTVVNDNITSNNSNDFNKP